jgi:UPF0755 protein
VSRRSKRGGRPRAAPRRGGGPRPRRAGVLAVVLLVAFAAGLFLYAGPGPAARSGRATTVVLEPGSGVRKIAAALAQAGTVRSALAFIAAAKLTPGRTLKAGEYAIPSRASMGRILGMLRRGDVVHHFVTLPEGLTSAQAVAILMAHTELAGPAEVPAEGSLLPETYEVDRGAARAAVLQRMHQAQRRLMDQLWPRRRPDLPLSTPEQAIILASIVEKETGLPEERGRVAAVFVNRLRAGMALASDPTVVYGISKGEVLGHGLRQSELSAATPYNTYRFAGLPPTPICNPGKAAIAAVLNPADTKDLYFVADGSGGHVFAATLAEHEKNVARWRRIEQTQGAAVAKGSAAHAR